MTYIPNDGGKDKSSYPDERMDCAVRAVAAACHLTYDDAHELLRVHACRKDRHKVYGDWINNLRTLGGLSVYRVTAPNTKTLQSFLRDKQFRKGRYVLRLVGHALAVIDGVVHDTFEPRPLRRVREIWKVI